ncbi:unnamed protein product [Plutella xylostella]|uniref:(diamondback moth) hypothetical protein n=1 Tax=Plutella xylostella TaxID=51655 RepID=A0A8S4DYW9_PLUXY|nr:unnamed protein product [Plutella xylostella]
MDRPRYNTVVRRCALDRDFALLPFGDKTLVGERGVSLSGGPKLLINGAPKAYLTARELRRRSGGAAAKNKRAFPISQPSSTLTEEPMDRPRYNTVVRRCALDRDFALLPFGDKTLVGERGVSLSGGECLRERGFETTLNGA